MEQAFGPFRYYNRIQHTCLEYLGVLAEKSFHSNPEDIAIRRATHVVSPSLPHLHKRDLNGLGKLCLGTVFKNGKACLSHC